MLNLPRFLCIGATKAGTTWLNDQLDQHPGVLMPAIKELHYFDALHVPGHREWTAKTVTAALKEALQEARSPRDGSESDKARVRHIRKILDTEIFSDEWYRRCFTRPGNKHMVAGEITPAYAELPDEGITHVLSLLPSVRIIYLIREPLSRAMSHLRMSAFRRKTPATEKDLRELIDSEHHILSRGRYELYLPRWRRFVPQDRLLVLPFGHIKSQPEVLIAQVTDFIGVDRLAQLATGGAVNKTRDIDIPASVKDYLTEAVAPTRAFLLAEFGPEFLESTR